MANAEHVEHLKRSIREWNRWREEQRDIRPDLSSADLCGADLSEADRSRAKLCYANLIFADLSRADLSRTDLSYANLSYANLSEADLNQAKPSGANLIQANLSQANLSQANLDSANLREANFEKAFFRGTLFISLDLNEAKGLETARHQGPSTVNINSVILPSDEQTRVHFLRGVGFTETQIEYLPSLLTPCPIEFHSLFISYAHQDEALAQQLYAYLRKQNVPCWFAPHDLQPGNYMRERIDQAIHTQDKLLLLLSKDSVSSGWMRYEVEQALARENTQQREILFSVAPR